MKEAARDRTATELKESQQEQQGYNWTTCPLSHRPLAQPIVSDSLGKLYNKDSVLQFLLPAEDGASKADSEEFLGGRIRSLKDVVEVKFEVEKDESTASRNGGGRRVERWVCPVTRKELGPNVKSVYLVPCGHAFSESAIKEVSEENCVQVSWILSPWENTLTVVLSSATSPSRRRMSSLFFLLLKQTSNG